MSLEKLFRSGAGNKQRLDISEEFFPAPSQKHLETTLRNWLPLAINVKLTSNVKVLVMFF